MVGLWVCMCLCASLLQRTAEENGANADADAASAAAAVFCYRTFAKISAMVILSSETIVW